MLSVKRSEDCEVEVDAGLALMQLKIEPSIKEVRQGVRKEKMASARNKKNKKTRVKRSKSTDNTRIVELRKERSRDAARTRRGKENAQFDELAKLLPLPSAIASQLDKASIVRLTISYLDMKQFVRKARRERPRSDTSLFSESSASPMSECGTDRLTGSPGSPSPNSSVSSPPMSAVGAVVQYHPADTSVSSDFGSDSGLHLLQALDGFLFVLSNEGKVLYVSETVSVHLGLSQVELTGSSMYGYLHPDDHDDLARILDEATKDLESGEVNPSTSGLFDNEIPFFRQQRGTIFASGHKTPTKEKPKSFFLRMKCTLVRRGGAYTKSSGFKVIHCMGRMKKYISTDLSPPKYAFVAMGQPLPTMNINELPLECNMFVSRVNMDLRIVYCEGRIHKFMDYFARDIVGISAYDFYHANDIATIQIHHAKFLSRGQVLTKYYRWMNKNGGWVWLQTKASLIPHPTNPELKQMLCLNYIVSDVEHRGVVLGMAQLDDKPNLHRPGAYITEVENESDSSGQNLKDAQYDDQVMVYPKWHETSDNLVPKPTLLDTLALTRTGYDVKTTGLETNMLENDVFSTATSSQWPQASTAVTMSRGSGDSSKGEKLATSCGSTSTVDDDLEDITEIIDAEMSDLDREFVAYVLSGSETPITAQPNLGTSTVSQENVVTGMIPPKDQSGLNSGVPKMEEVSMDGLEDATPVALPGSTCSVKDPGLAPQVFGRLPVGVFPSDTKAGVVPLNQETDLLELTFTTESSKLRVTNSPCMFSNVRATNSTSRAPFSNYMDQPMPANAPSMVPRTGNVMKMPSVTPSRSVTFTSQSRTFGGSPLQKREVTSTVTSVPGSFHSPLENSCTAVQSDEQMRFLQELKSSFPSENSFSEDFLVNLVDEMMQDAEAQRRKDEKLALCLQQGGYQMEGIVKQEVVTPTMAQPTSLFNTFFNTLARQESQPSGMHRQGVRRVNSYGSNPNLPATCTSTMPQYQRTQSLSGSTLRRHENGATRVPNNHHIQFTGQEDSNMNCLNSLSSGRIVTNNMQAPLQENPPSNRHPKQQPPAPMQQAIRDILQNTNNTATKQSTNLAPQLNPNMVSRQHVGTIPQQNFVTLPQTTPLRNQSNAFNNMAVNPTMNQLDYLQLDQISSPLHTVPQQNSGYRNLNGSDMPTIHQLNHTFDFCENL